jgi:uncharacterized protein YfcZ (UPF0381/DUF406 family)
MMMNCMNCNNVDLNTIMSNIDALQKDNKVKLKCLHNDEKKINNIIKLLTKTLMLKKKKSKDHL